MRRYFLYLSYNGSRYCGWQNQPNGIAVQQKIEDALGILLRQPTAITGAGRTDSGVHAAVMAAHFDADLPVETSVLADKLNRILPEDIAILRIVPVQPEAHARFDALSRTYRYYLSTEKDPFRHALTYKVHGCLDLDAMNEAAKELFNYIDFTSFSKLHTDVKTNNCKIMHARWERQGSEYVFTIQADRFLRNMVRAIVGTLLDVGRGKLSVKDFCRIIEAKDRGKAGSSVPGHALFLVDVEYPQSLFL